ncbi:MAG TPA: PilZ domain-containing protein [Nitrospiraceae bacterium]|nr:PilZ domain-containing protein [Nitrospiraceae bacterium]
MLSLTGLNEGHGTVWNVSLNGWRLSGDLPLRIGQSFPMTVTLPNHESVFVAAGIVRWKRGDEYGVETLVVDDAALDQVGHYVKQRVEKEGWMCEGTTLNGNHNSTAQATHEG